jgi:starch phosphorylase
MEMGIDGRIPTYSGGLGVLAGDMAYSFADLGLPAIFVTLLSRSGYTSQRLDAATGQADSPQPWDWGRILSPLEAKAAVEIGERRQTIGAWEYRIRGKSETSILFLNSDYPENDPEVREATDRLYDGEPRHRLLQDIILGIGGYRVLNALGRDVDFYHLNESHAAFATTELLRDTGDIAATRRRCAFTTHTPVPAGTDVFPLSSVEGALRKYPWVDWGSESVDGAINLSRLASKYCGVTNAVSMKHRFVSERVMGYNDITYVTNGVYHKRWVHPELRKTFDTYIPGWAESPSLLVRALLLPSDALAQAHAAAKKILISTLNTRPGPRFEEDALTISVAKRITGYKRNGMILEDLDRLQRIAEASGRLQLVIAGKTHPRDGPAKAMLSEILRKADILNRSTGKVRVAVLENYDIEMAKVLVAGSDVWLNNPRRPLEACGTSGMKAAMNGVLNLSVNDGWWLEGGVEGVNGWGVGRRTEWADPGDSRGGEDEEDLYNKLSNDVLPVFYHDSHRWTEMQKSSIATVGPLFNSYRMVEDYVTKVYSRASGVPGLYRKP